MPLTAQQKILGGFFGFAISGIICAFATNDAHRSLSRANIVSETLIPYNCPEAYIVSCVDSDCPVQTNCLAKNQTGPCCQDDMSCWIDFKHDACYVSSVDWEASMDGWFVSGSWSGTKEMDCLTCECDEWFNYKVCPNFYNMEQYKLVSGHVSSDDCNLGPEILFLIPTIICVLLAICFLLVILGDIFCC